MRAAVGVGTLALVMSACTPSNVSDPIFDEPATGAPTGAPTSTTTTTVPTVGSPLPPAPASGTFVPVREPSGLAGCPLFPRDSVFHADIRHAPVDAGGDERLAAWESLVPGDTAAVIPTAEYLPGLRYGMPVNVVNDGTNSANLVGLYHNPSATFIERAPLPSPIRLQHTSDRHGLVLDASDCSLHEMLNLRYVGLWLFGEFRGWVTDGAGNWDLAETDYHYRATHPSSAAATALPILPSLLRVDDVLSSEITHSLRFSVPTTAAGEIVWPARRTDGTSTAPGALPEGLWLRLTASFDDTDMSPEAQRIIRALKVHGMRLDDTGGNDNAFTITAELSSRWETEQVADPRGGTRPLSAVLDEVTAALTAPAPQLWDVIEPDAVMIAADDMAVR